jgi:hypothetical protein
MPGIEKSFREIGQIIAPRGHLAAPDPKSSDPLPRKFANRFIFTALIGSTPRSDSSTTSPMLVVRNAG